MRWAAAFYFKPCHEEVKHESWGCHLYHRDSKQNSRYDVKLTEKHRRANMVSAVNRGGARSCEPWGHRRVVKLPLEGPATVSRDEVSESYALMR